MKIKTTAGDSLRNEYTALECAAIKYAVLNQLADGSTFVGVPDATEERYRNCKDVFKVDTCLPCTSAQLKLMMNTVTPN